MLGLTAPDLLVLAAYFVVIAVIGVASARLIRNREDFFMGGRRFGKLLMIFFSFGAGTHADNAVGVAAKCYQVRGLAGIWYQWTMLFTLPLYWLLAPVFRRARVLTTADFFERRYGSRFMLLYAVFALFICIAYTGSMLFASAKLVEALTAGAIPWPAGIWVIGSVSFLYGVLGGLVAAVWNDLFQGLLTIVMSLLILPFFWVRIGGAEGFRAALGGQGIDPGEAFRLVMASDLTPYWIVMMSINMLFSMVVQPHIMASAGAAKSEMDSRVGFVGGMILKRLITVPWALTGVMAVALLGAGTIDADFAFGRMARVLLPAGCTGLMLACVMASVMDNCAVFMLSFSGIYTNSIHKRFLRPEADERALVAVGRGTAACFAVVSIALAYAFTDVPQAMEFLWKTVPLMGIAFFLGLWWRGANRYGAFASFAAALAALLAGEFALEWKGSAGLPKVISLYLGAGITAGVVVSLLTRPEPRRALDAFYLLLNTPIGREEDLRKAGLTEVPGTGTFEIPPTPPEGEEREAPPPTYPKLFRSPRWEVAVPGRQAVAGFAAVAALMLAMLGGLKWMAVWLAGG